MGSVKRPSLERAATRKMRGLCSKTPPLDFRRNIDLPKTPSRQQTSVHIQCRTTILPKSNHLEYPGEFFNTIRRKRTLLARSRPLIRAISKSGAAGRCRSFLEACGDLGAESIALVLVLRWRTPSSVFSAPPRSAASHSRAGHS